MTSITADLTTPLDLELLRAQEEKPFLGTLWTHGDRGMMTPQVCGEKFGDGTRAIRIATINQRPNYHVVRVDGTWSDDDVLSHIDEITRAIASEFGYAGKHLEDECETCEDHICRCNPQYSAQESFPQIDERVGCSWQWIALG